MLWLLIVIHLNLQSVPIQVEHGEIIGTFQNAQDCNKKHAEFFEAAKADGQVIPPFFNLGCIMLIMVHV